MIKTIILCGGKGTRLRPLTQTIPKPLVPLNGKPCLQHTLESYIAKGQKQFILCTGYRSEMIKQFVAQNQFDAEIIFSDAGENASMLQRLYQARSLIDDRAYVVYGDTFLDVDLKGVLIAHQKSKARITISTAEVRSPFGLITMDDNQWVSSYQEKPLQPYYVGHMLLEKSVLDNLDQALLEMPDGSGLVALFQKTLDEKLLKAYKYEGPQITFNTHKDLDQAERDLHAFFTQEENE